MIQNISADVRSARLVKTVQALVLLHPDIPTSTRKRLTDATRAVRLLVEVDDSTRVVEAATVASQIVSELEDVSAEWQGQVKALAERLIDVFPKRRTP